MAKDSDTISKETHELNYLLKKWGKRQSQGNRDKLVAKIDEFNANTNYRTHNRADFYAYVDFPSTLE